MWRGAPRFGWRVNCAAVLNEVYLAAKLLNFHETTIAACQVIDDWLQGIYGESAGNADVQGVSRRKEKIARELVVHDFAPNLVFITLYISMCYGNFRGKNAVNVITLYIFLIKFN